MTGGVHGTLIDVHSHIAPLNMPGDPAPGAGLAWPCVVCGAAHAATLMVGSKPFRELDNRSAPSIAC
jgi:aminocarboxymuconate-semialdehyde decarboxylase